MTTFPDLSRRIRVHEMQRASSFRQHYFSDQRRPRSWRHRLAVGLLLVCLAVLLGEIARWTEWMLK